MSTTTDGSVLISDVIVWGQNPPEGSPKTQVFVGILSRNGNLRAELFAWREYLMSLSADPAHPYFYRVGQVLGAQPAVLAHNVLAHVFHSHPELGDWLWIWADDMRPLPTTTTLLECIDKGADLATLMVYIWSQKDNAPLLTAGFEHSEHLYELWNLPRSEGIYALDSAGTGGLLVHRRVFDDPRMKLAEADGDQPAAWFQDTYFPSGAREHGHDLDFTRRATKLGYKLLGHPDAWAGHIKTLDLFEVALYVERFALMAMRAKAKGWAARLSKNPDAAGFVSALEALIRDDLGEEEEGEDKIVKEVGATCSFDYRSPVVPDEEALTAELADDYYDDSGELS